MITKKQIHPIIFVVAILMSFWVMATATAQGPTEPNSQMADEGTTQSNTEVTPRQAATATPIPPVSQYLPIQGQLTDNAGQAINGNRRVTFALYREATGGTALCETTQPTVAVSAGFFNTTIQLSTTACDGLKPTEVINGQKIYLGIKVENDPEMSPRQELLPTSYALGLAPDVDIDGTIDGNSTLYVVNRGRDQTVNDVILNSKVIMGWSASPSGKTYGLYGFNSSNEGQGVRGYAGSTRGTTYGVVGISYSSNGRGVYGEALTVTGVTYGVAGVNHSPEGIGVRGLNVAPTGKAYGVFGRSDSSEGIGVYGTVNLVTGTTYAVFGENPSDNGRGVYGFTSALSGTTYGVYGKSQSDMGMGVYGLANAISGTTYGVYGRSYANMGMGIYGVAEAITGTTYGVYGKSQSPDGAAVMAYNNSSGVGVNARSEQGNPIEAYGNVATHTLFKVTQQGDVYAQGSYHCGGVISQTNTMISDTLSITGVTRSDLSPCLQDNNQADFAEMLPTNGDQLEPGDVLAINLEGELVRSDTAYQSTVMGVYSTRPSYLGSSQLLGQENHVPLALVGIVPVKASAENGPIKPGDLLTASNTPGHAMRADKNAPNGTVIGKALGRLDAATGLIRMVVMLQ